ncbi:MAG: sensor domain-containing diguanylate cyclase [Betaproteobacteria bacterium]|nr:sensor domain-containing diguanylate cyclase [Betaproteobacteria bacterium]
MPAPPLALFAPEPRIAELARTLEHADAAGVVEWAWYSRQRETLRAKARVAALGKTVPAEWAGRAALVEAEAARLFAQHALAAGHLARAAESFAAQGDDFGLGDTCFIEAMVAHDVGESGTRDRLLAEAHARFRNAGDTVRLYFIEARQAVDAAFRQPADAEREWGARLAAIEAQGEPAVNARIAEFRAWVAFSRADFAEAAQHYLHAFELALASAQWPMAVMEMANAGASLAELNDHESALAYLEQGLALARAGNWPASLGICLIQAANSSRELERLDAAAEFLAEAKRTLAPLEGGRLYAIVLQYHGDLALARGDAVGALDWYRQFEARAQVLKSPDLFSHALRGRAQALTRLGERAPAREAALAGLDVAREMGDVPRQITLLRALARLADDSAAGRREAQDCLEAAVAIARDVKGYAVPGELFAELAALHARERDFERAYALALEAAQVSAAGEVKRATDKMLALQVRHATERATLEAEQQRRVAAAEALRAQALEDTNATLSRLGIIGQEITATLEIETMIRVLSAKAGAMLEADCVALWTVDEAQRELLLRFGMEGSSLMPRRRVAFDREDSNVAETYRQRREMLFENRPGEINLAHIPGTRPMLSALFGPLMVGERILGILSVQSERAHAYGERERLVFRSLCAFGAVALANAEAYEAVQAARRALEEASLTDPLTGLRNRRYLTQLIDTDVAGALRRAEEPRSGLPPGDLVFFLVDIDHFKQVNDQYGHAAGDAVLKQMKPRLMNVFREADHVLRWGGEEFLVVARQADRATAGELAERLRRAIADTPFVLDDGHPLAKSCSIGVAAFPFLRAHPRALTWEDAVELADLALYAAKKSGRDAWVMVEADADATPDAAKRAVHHAAEALVGHTLRLASSRDLARVAAVFGT